MKILPLPEIYSGQDSLYEIKGILNKINALKIMVITDQGIVNAGIYKKLEAVIKQEDKEIILFDKVLPDPSIELVESAVNIARKLEIDAVIGIGGGSSIDTAKVVAALIPNTKNISQYIGTELIEQDSLPIIAIPTTAGTGSEVTPIAILSDEKEQLKKGIVSSKIIPDFAILDPLLTTGLPPKVTAATGMDALIHAIEAFTSLNSNIYTDMLALKAIKIITENIREVYNNGANIIARNNMLSGSLLAGMAFANAGVAAVHAFAYPLGGMFHIPHGLANSVMLSSIMEFNLEGSENKYIQIANIITGKEENDPTIAVSGMVNLCRDLDIPMSLVELNIPESSITQMAEAAMKVTRLLANNPRKITFDDAVELYKKAYKGNIEVEKHYDYAE